MLEFARIVHEALGIESTSAFILTFTILFGALGGGAAFLIDRPYKRTLAASAKEEAQRQEIRHGLNQLLLEGGGYHMTFPWFFRPTVEQGTGKRLDNDPLRIGPETLKIQNWHYRAVMFAHDHLGETYASRLMIKNRSTSYPFGIRGNDIYESVWDTITSTNQSLTDFMKELPEK